MKVYEIDSCYIVNCCISIDRAVKYNRVTVGEELHDDGSETKEYLTTREYKSAFEAKAAQALYSWARNSIHKWCVNTPMGYACPEYNLESLQATIEEIDRKVKEEVSKFKHCSVDCDVVVIELSSNNLAGSKVINKTMTRTMESIKDALVDLDIKKVKDMLNNAKNMAGLFSDKETKASIAGFQKEVILLTNEIAKAIKDTGNNIELAKAALEAKGTINTVIGKFQF